jgi:hypothetical protein
MVSAGALHVVDQYTSDSCLYPENFAFKVRVKRAFRMLAPCTTCIFLVTEAWVNITELNMQLVSMALRASTMCQAWSLATCGSTRLAKTNH